MWYKPNEMHEMHSYPAMLRFIKGIAMYMSCLMIALRWNDHIQIWRGSKPYIMMLNQRL
jgi:hypothetical protein